MAQQLGQVHVAGQRHAVLAVGGEDVVLGLAARPEPICAASWPVSGTHRASWPCRCRAVASWSKRRIGAMSRVEAAQLSGVELGSAYWEEPDPCPRCRRGQQLDHRRRRAQAGLGFAPQSWSVHSVPSNSVEGRWWRPYRLLALPHPNAPQSLGYMPDREYIPGPAYISLVLTLSATGRDLGIRAVLSARNAVAVLYRSHRVPGTGCWLPPRRC